jgi:hypothetical protein
LDFDRNTLPQNKYTELQRKIRGILGEKNYCSVAFLDITQTFDKVWHPGLLFKIRKILSHAYYRILESYLTDRLFQVKFKDEITTLRKTKADVP